MRPKTVLLVEDDAVSELSEAGMLREAGFAVLSARSGEEAVELVSRGSEDLDLVIMDVELGRGMDGTAAAREILKLAALPIIFLSAHTEAEYVSRIEGIANYGYVPKCAGPHILLAAMRRALDLHATKLGLKQADEELADTEAHYHVLFNDLSDAVAEEDFSKVKEIIDELGPGVDYEAYFSSHPEEVRRCASLIRIVDFNQEYLRINNVIDRSDMPPSISSFVPDGVLPIIQREIVSLAEGDRSMRVSFRNTMEDSSVEYIRLKLSLVSGHESDWSSVLVYFTDVTAEMRTRETLEALLKEKEVLMQELEHRVKNNLSIVSSILGMEAADAGDEKAKSTFLEAQLRIQSISLIYELLAHSSPGSTINCKSYLSDLSKLLYETYVRREEEVSLRVEVEDFAIDVKRGVYLGLIINELLTNSFKYAFPDRKGSVSLSLATSEDKLSLAVEDDGVGAGEGFAWGQASGLGSKLIDMLVLQLKGSLELRTSPGFRVAIGIPLEA